MSTYVMSQETKDHLWAWLHDKMGTPWNYGGIIKYLEDLPYEEAVYLIDKGWSRVYDTYMEAVT